jgi:branched-chain amino acid transport system permease protein
MERISHYREYYQIYRKWWQRVLFLLGVFLFLTFPFFATEYEIYLLTLFFIHTVGILGQNLLIGYAGQISLGQVAFLVAGAFSYGNALRWEVPFPFALLFSFFVGSLLGIVVGIPSLRLKGPYLAIATLGLGLVILQIVSHTPKISGGGMGFTLPPTFGWLWNLNTEKGLYYFSFLSALFFLFGSYYLTFSFVGRAWMAIREGEMQSEVLGISLPLYKLFAFALSSGMTAFSGALYGQLHGYLEPQTFSFLDSIYYLAGVLVGGAGTVTGSVFGSFFVVVVPQIFSGAKEWVPVLFGFVMLLTILFEPLGLYGFYLRVKLYFQNFPFR